MPSAIHVRGRQGGFGDGSKDRKQNGRWRRSIFMAGLFIVGTLLAWRGITIGGKQDDGTRRGRTADCLQGVCASGVGSGRSTAGKTKGGTEGEDGCQEAPPSEAEKDGPPSGAQEAVGSDNANGRPGADGSGPNKKFAPPNEVRCNNTSRLASGDQGQEGGNAGLPCEEVHAVDVAVGTAQDEVDGCNGRRLVFIKSFKTGSTTLATYLTQIGSQDAADGGGCYFLHPETGGKFKEGELQSRLKAGQRFDISVRHITPQTPYDALAKLVPGAIFMSIMRNPLDRFLSLFNYRHDLKRMYKTPEALIEAIGEDKLSSGDSRPFCNQLAWLLSGKDVDYTGVDNLEEARRVAGEVIVMASKWNVTILLTERMSDSIVVLADRMQWNMEDLELRLGMHRVQKRSRPTPRNSQGYYYTCAAAANSTPVNGKTQGDNKTAAEQCEEAIRKCNMVDDILYSHYEQQFNEVLNGIVGAERSVQVLEKKPQAKKSMSSLEAGKYPINCVEAESAASHPGAGVDPETEAQTYDRLHSCHGRVHQ